jgi:proteic killer suppression protein
MIGPVIRSFADAGTEDVFNGRSTKAARKAVPGSLIAVARRKLDALNAAQRLEDLRVPPGNRLEALKGDRAGQHSVRINDQFRICFTWSSEGPELVEIVDYH